VADRIAVLYPVAAGQPVDNAAMRLPLALLLAATATLAHAVERCDIDGRSVNPANGATTAGQTGLMRCRDGDDGPVVREQELRNGVFMGIVRHYRNGVLQREYSVNEKGNRDGRSREYAGLPGADNPLLRDETMRNGSTVGLARSWFPNGQLRRATFYGDDGREQAYAEFNAQGQLSELHCAGTAVLAPVADDAAWCGHRGKAAAVDLYGPRGTLRTRLTHEAGQLRRNETFWDNGRLHDQVEIGSDGGVERSFTADGVRTHEARWINPPNSGGRVRLFTLDQEFHETSGTLVRERRWAPDERGSTLQSEQRWYLNGQLRESAAYSSVQGQRAVLETRFHDNGQPAGEGLWLLAGRNERQPSGVHKSFDDQGRLRSERHYDARGRLARERELDETGHVLRDDELFEDGSRKAFAR